MFLLSAYLFYEGQLVPALIVLAVYSVTLMMIGARRGNKRDDT